MAQRAILTIITIATFGFIALLIPYVSAKGLCAERQFQCGDGRCIPITWACEGEADCADGSDEKLPECKGGRKEKAASDVTTTEVATAATEDVAPLAEPPVAAPTSSRGKTADFDYSLKMAQRLPLGGVLQSSDALRMVGMVRKLPLQLIDNPSIWGLEDLRSSPPCDPLRDELDDPAPEPRRRCGRAKNSDPTTASPKAEELSADDVLNDEEDLDLKPDVENRKRKQKPKGRPTTPAPVRGSGHSEDESHLRREMARVNLDVLRRLASMLGEEREKFMAERQMLSASRDMMVAETRRVNSERGKIEAEKQKVDLERDLLQSQMLGRRSPRLAYLSDVA